jgi:hypothetical protein
MQYAQLKWPAPFVVATIVAGTAAATIPHVGFIDLFLDTGTGVLAGLGAVIAGTRLSVGRLESGGRIAWTFALAVLLFVALGEFSEPFAEAAQQQLHIDNIDDLLLLAVAPLTLWHFARLKPVQIVPQRWMLVGFAMQVVATGLDFFDDSQVQLRLLHSIDVATYADFMQFLSTLSYVLALSRAALDTGKRQFIQDRLYPPAFILGRGRLAAGSSAGRIHRLCNQVRWPAHDILGSTWNVGLIACWPFIASVRACQVLKVHGARVQWLTGKTKPEQFIEQLGLALRHRIPPAYYTVYEFYRPGQRRQAGDYLMRHETTAVAYRLLDPRPKERDTPAPLADKVDFARHCRRHGLRHIPVLMVFDSGKCLTGSDIVNRLPDADIFVKPVLGTGGGGPECWHSLGDSRFKNLRGDHLEAGALLAHVARLSLSRPYLIQSAVTNHREISRLSAGALSTVRILSCRNERGDFEVTNAAFLMSVDPLSPVDSFDAGGVAAAVDLKTGTLGFATDLGQAPGTDWHARHPYSGAEIAGSRLPMWRETVDLALRAHRVFNDAPVVGWDIAILDDGPCLIAGNREPDVDILQRTADAPIGAGRFGELLAYHLERSSRVR